MSGWRSGPGFRGRALSLAAVVSAVGVGLGASGCSVPALERVGMGVGSYTTTWTVGSCHRLDQLTETDPVYNSDTSPAVPCSSSHESETFAVLPIVGAVAQQAERPSPEVLQEALSGACSSDMLATFLGEQSIDALDNVSVVKFVPSVPEWRAGVRKVRCDALVGPRTTQAVASISRTLHGILTTAAGARFRACRLGDVAVPCDGLHTAELVEPEIEFTGAELAKGQAYEIAKVLDVCDAAVDAYVGVPLAKRPDLKLYPQLPGQPPDVSSKVGQCWVGPADGLSTAGSVRRTGGSGKVS